MSLFLRNLITFVTILRRIKFIDFCFENKNKTYFRRKSAVQRVLIVFYLKRNRLNIEKKTLDGKTRQTNKQTNRYLIYYYVLCVTCLFV